MNRYWISSDGTFNNTINWSESSGGPSGATIPDSTDIAIFDSNSGSCTIDATTSALQFNLGYDYTSTVFYTNPVYLKNLTLAGGYLTTSNESSMFISGDASCLSSFGSFSPSNNANLVIDGSGIQYISVGGIYPNVMIDKTTTNQVIFIGDVPYYGYGELVINDGTLNTNGHDIILR